MPERCEEHLQQGIGIQGIAPEQDEKNNVIGKPHGEVPYILPHCEPHAGGTGDDTENLHPVDRHHEGIAY